MGQRRAGRAIVLWLVVVLLMGSRYASGQTASMMAGDSAVIQVDAGMVTGSAPLYYGVEYGWIDQDRALFLERYRLLRPNLLRVQINQELFEPRNDNSDPNVSAIDFNVTIPVDTERGKSITYRDLFTTLAQEFPQMRFDINLWLSARWNAANANGYLDLGGAFPPKNWAEYAEFVRELARWLVNDCGIQPTRLSFSFVNEPNISAFFAGSPAELVKMAAETRKALTTVSPSITLSGLDEVHGTSWTDAFYPNRPAGCCDHWSFHAYENGLPALWQTLQTTSEHLSSYGPVWVTEFADTANGSPDAKMDFSTRSAALGFAGLVGRLWGSGIQGMVHFRLADTYTKLGSLQGWAGHGLFADWRGTKSGGKSYQIYPSFWVFANLYNEFGGSLPVETNASSELVVMAARRTDTRPARVAVWVTNPRDTGYTTYFTIDHFPSSQAAVQVIDNLSGRLPVQTLLIKGAPLSFALSLAPRSSYTLRILPVDASGVVPGDGKVFLPLTGR